MVRKGQAAMEFLMTYGWAILVVLAAIGALAYFGVLSPDNFLPNKCTISPEFACVESKVDTTGLVTLGIQNNVGQTLAEVNVTLGLIDSSCTFPAGVHATNTSIRNGQRIDVAGTPELITVQCNAGTFPGIGEKFAADVQIDYVISGQSVVHTASGSLQRKVEN